jgi:hypothetical protein
MNQPVTILFPCHQRGCDHAEPAAATIVPGGGKTGDGFELRLSMTADAKDDLMARLSAHLGNEECTGCHFIERDGATVLRLPMMGVEIPLGTAR